MAVVCSVLSEEPRSPAASAACLRLPPVTARDCEHVPSLTPAGCDDQL